jgi:hypothetical protein
VGACDRVLIDKLKRWETSSLDLVGMDRSFWILYMFFQSSGEIGRRIRITIPHSFILQVPLKLPPAPASVLASISKRVSPNDTLNPHHRQARPKLSTCYREKNSMRGEVE